MQGSGVRVQGAGFRVQGAGLRVEGAGFRVRGLPGGGLEACGRVPGFGFGLSDFWLQAFGG